MSFFIAPNLGGKYSNNSYFTKELFELFRKIYSRLRLNCNILSIQELNIDIFTPLKPLIPLPNFTVFRPFLGLLLASLMLFVACSKDPQITRDSGAKLEFSEDTVLFDTVFTTVGTTTYALKAYNRNDQAVEISSIRLAGGETSEFRINIDGRSAVEETDYTLRSGDSIYIFIEATIDPNNTAAPLIRTDSIVFETNGNVQDVDLVAWGQDAHFYYNHLFCGDVLEADKPHVFYGYAVVDSSCGLFILEGAQLHFHSRSGLVVYKDASMRVLGTAENPVVFQGDRLEEDYKELAGQWDRIWLFPTSHSNVIQHAIIKNGTVGVQSDTLGHPIFPTLRMTNTVIDNMSNIGVLGRGTWLTMDNCVVSNSGEFALAFVYGGAYSCNHVTVANYWDQGARENPSVLLNNYFETAAKNIQSRDLLQAQFTNCVIYGDKEEEIAIDQEGANVFNYVFDHSILKTQQNTTDTVFYKDVIANPGFITVDGALHHPIFNDVTEWDFSLFETSVAVDQGNVDYGLLDDVAGNERDAMPDIGAYEYLP